MDIADLIHLQDSKVVEVTIDKRDNIFITVETTELSVACRLCGKQLTKRHGSDQVRKLRHLPILGNHTYIIYKPIAIFARIVIIIRQPQQRRIGTSAIATAPLIMKIMY